MLRASLQRVSAQLGFEAIVAPLPDADPRARLTLTALEGPAFEGALAAVGAQSGVTERRVGATYLHAWVAYYVLAPVLEVLLAEGRLLHLEPDGPAIAWDGVTALTVVYGGAATVLPDDELAGLPGIAVASDMAALTDRLHDEMLSCFEGLGPLFRAQAGLSLRFCWLQLADRAALTLQEAGARAGREAEAIEIVRRLTERPDSPLCSTRAGFELAQGEGPARQIYRRAVCCEAFNVPDRDYCMTCPALDEGGRARRIRAWLVEQVGGESGPGT